MRHYLVSMKRELRFFVAAHTEPGAKEIAHRIFDEELTGKEDEVEGSRFKIEERTEITEVEDYGEINRT